MIYFSDTKEQMRDKISRPAPRAPSLCSRPAASFDRSSILRTIPKEKLNGIIILTGHQPTFHHPGILIKNVLAHNLARQSGGIAIHMVHDTDAEEIIFPYPERVSDIVKKKSAKLNDASQILRHESFKPADRSAMLRLTDALRSEVRLVFGPEMIGAIHGGLDLLEKSVREASRPMDVPDRLRLAWEAQNRIDVYTVYSSDLFESSSFQCFFEHVREHGDRFREIYNRLLADYRRAKGIKNPAQPLPDLRPKELPFWVVQHGNRLPFIEGETSDGQILPRAVTLTLFCRLFFCDVFVHGLGGERYDRITDEILREFFDFAGAPFTAASATLALSSRADLRIFSRSTQEVERDLRAVEFDPTRFLAKTDRVRREKEDLIAEWHKNPASRSRLHREFVRLNEQARHGLNGVIENLEWEKNLARVANANRTFFGARDLPYFFYDLSEIFQTVKDYVFFEKRSPSASLAEARS
jgi:hypothetical protein